MSIMERDDLIEGDIGEMGDYSVVELLVEQAEAHGRQLPTHPGFNQGPLAKKLVWDFGFHWISWV